MTQRFICQYWQQPNFRAVNKFYRSQKHKGSASADESVFVIYDHETSQDSSDSQPEVVAAVRLVPHDGYFWLRSLYVKQALRGQGLGLQLLSFVHGQIAMPIYCFPYIHLDDFYGQAGYEKLAPNQLPQPLEQLFNRYQNKGSDSILAMVKP